MNAHLSVTTDMTTFYIAGGGYGSLVITENG